MKPLLLIVLVATALMPPAQARLGETPEQLVARYGQPLNESDQKGDGDKIAMANVTFQKGGFQIDVTITNGFSVLEKFKKQNGAPITVPEARLLLSANAQGHEWAALRKTATADIWTRDDEATATLASDGTMSVRSRELVVEESTAKKLLAKPSLDGF